MDATKPYEFIGFGLKTTLILLYIAETLFLV